MSAQPPHRRGACPALAAPMPTGDGLLVRLACSGTTIGLDAMTALCAAVRRHGNGIIEVTARGNIQVRGLSAASAPAFAAAVAPLGIDAGDGVAIIVDPLAGLAPAPAIDARGIASAVHERLANAPFAAALGPKVSIVIDGGSALNLDAIQADIRLRADGGRWMVSVGGDAASAAPIGCVVNGAEAAVRLLELIARQGPQARASDLVRLRGAVAFQTALTDLSMEVVERSRAASFSPPQSKSDVSDFDHHTWRSRVNPTSRGDGLGVRVGRYGRALPSGTPHLPNPHPQGGRKSRAAAPQPIGTHPLWDGRCALGIGLAFGHTDANALEGVIVAARGLGANGLRAMPGRALLVIGLTNEASQAFAADAERLGFINRPDDPRRSVVACAGAPICASAEIPARSLAPLLSAAGAQLLDGSLTIHLSGCRKGCAHPGPAALTLVGTKSGCDLVVDGSARDDAHATVAMEALSTNLARLATEIARTRQPAETCAATLARLGAARVAQIFGARHA
jgi:precorrin-3B synthase